MHEVSVALAILEEVSERVPSSESRVAAVHLRIGAMTAIDTAALTFAWELATEGTPACGSRLKIERVPLVIRCAACAQDRTIESGTLPVCPVCATPSNDIAAGRELQITLLEVLDAAEASGSSAEYSTQERDFGVRTAQTLLDAGDVRS